MRATLPVVRIFLAVALVGGCMAGSALLTGCSSGPVVPAWQSEAKDALDRANAAYLEGDTHAAQAEMARVRRTISGTGRADWLAQAELAHCAARTASLVLEACAEFEALRPDATRAQRAYADYLAGQWTAERATDPSAALPASAQSIAQHTGSDTAVLQGLTDPMSRLLGAAVWLQQGRASPATVAMAVETASTQGWRRPLLAWLGVQSKLAEQAGRNAERDAIRRRMALVEAQGRPHTTP